MRIFRRPKIGTWNAGNYREHWRLVYLFVFWNRQKWTFCFSCVFYGRSQTIEEGVTRFVIFSGCCAVGLERCILERPRVGGFGGAFQPRKYISLVRACKNCCSSTGWTSHNNGHSLAFFLPATAMTGIFGGLCSKITGKKGSPLTWTLFLCSRKKPPLCCNLLWWIWSSFVNYSACSARVSLWKNMQIYAKMSKKFEFRGFKWVSKNEIRYKIKELVDLREILWGSRVWCAEFDGQLGILKLEFWGVQIGRKLRVSVKWTPGRSVKIRYKINENSDFNEIWFENRAKCAEHAGRLEILKFEF